MICVEFNLPTCRSCNYFNCEYYCAYNIFTRIIKSKKFNLPATLYISSMDGSIAYLKKAIEIERSDLLEQFNKLLLLI